MQNVFERIGKSQTLSQEIQETIEEAILNKTFKPGQKLPTENEMCDMFGVSRTALREALQMLSARGLIAVRKGSGIYVEKFDPSHVTKPMRLFLELNFDKDYVKHIIEVRKMLEPDIVRLAARNRTDTDLLKMEKTLEDLGECSETDFEKEGLIDRDFHLAIANASGNPMIPLIVGPIFNIMPKIRMLVYATVEQVQNTVLRDHSRIFEKIKAQDEHGAFREMSAHLQLAEAHSQIIFQEFERM